MGALRYLSSTRRDRTGRLPKEHPTTSFGFYYKGRQHRNIAMLLPFRTEPTFASGKFATLPPAIRSGAKRFFSSGPPWIRTRPVRLSPGSIDLSFDLPGIHPRVTQNPTVFEAHVWLHLHSRVIIVLESPFKKSRSLFKDKLLNP